LKGSVQDQEEGIEEEEEAEERAEGEAFQITETEAMVEE